MRRNLFMIFVFVVGMAEGQALRDINYKYLYNPFEGFSLDLKPVKLNDGWKILYEFHRSDTAVSLGDFIIEWQGRDGLTSKEGVSLDNYMDENPSGTSKGFAGSLTIPLSDAPKVIVARVIKTSEKKAWMFFATLGENYPVNNYLTVGNKPLTSEYLDIKQPAKLALSDRSWIVSYYNDNFPPGAPGFSEAQAKVARAMRPDSVFQVTADSLMTFPRRGIYLFQKDTIDAAGVSVRAEDDYPRFTRIENLPGPLIYICTKAEYDKLELASDKKTFDRTVLSITGDTERAKKLMRNYFRRVEYANQYFTSYKEGWKTDRGMIYIIFGLPDKVYRFYDREVWEYENALFEVTFTFTKASSVFDPENFVLIRDNKYKQTWYDVIDLWRNARF